MAASAPNRSSTTVDITGQISLDAVRISTNNDALLEVVPSHGGVCNRLVFCDGGERFELIAGLESKEALESDKAFRGIPLFPLVNRLDAGRFSFEQKSYQLEVNETANNNALHGFIHHIQPSYRLEEGDEQSKLFLEYQYTGDLPGYPFKARLVMEYVLSTSNELSITFRVFNDDSQAIPFGFGWHPYFKINDSSVNKLQLQLPSVEQVLIDDRMLPTGETRAFTDFSELQTIGDYAFDTCFKARSSKAEDSATTVLWSPEQAAGIELTQSLGKDLFNYMQVCIDSTRQSIAIEPVTCNINALNTGEGLIVLPPGESCSAHYKIKLIRSI